MLFLGSALIASFGLHQIQPVRHHTALIEKLDYLRHNPGRFNLVFVGTSHMERGILPKVFDEAAANAGCDFRSFNFGVPALAPEEERYILDNLADLGIDRVVAEAQLAGRVLWHAGPSDIRASYDYLLAKHNARATSGFITDVSRLGRDILERLSESTWQSAGERSSGTAESRARMAESRGYAVSRLDAAPVETVFFEAYESLPRGEASRRFRKNLRKRISGEKRATLFMPSIGKYDWNYWTFGIETYRDFAGLPAFAFSDLSKYEALFNQALWHDPGHLNHTGAIMFSRLFAGEYCRHLNSDPDPTLDLEAD